MASQNDIAAAEAEFKKKFGGMGGGMKPRMGPGGMRGGMGGGGMSGGMNSVLAKRIQGGGQKWFDSGDYNMNKNKAQPNVPSPIYKAPSSSNGSGEGQQQQQQQQQAQNLPNPAFKQPNLPTTNQTQVDGVTSPTKSKLAN